MSHTDEFSGSVEVAESRDWAVGCAGAALEAQHDFFGAWNLADFIFEFWVDIAHFEHHFLFHLLFLSFFIF